MTYRFLDIPVHTPVVIASEQPILEGFTDNMQVTRFWNGSQRWRLQMQVTIADVEDQQTLMAHSLANRITTFSIPFPKLDETVYPAGAETTETDAGATELEVDSVNVLELKVGAYLNFANHPKIYMITSIAENPPRIGIFPALTNDVAAGTAIEFNNVMITCVYPNSGDGIIEQTFINGVINTQTIELVERI